MKEAISHKKRLSATRLDPARPPTGRDYDADSAWLDLRPTRDSAATYSPRFLASLRYTHRVVAVIFNQRTLDAIGRRDAHVLSTIVRAAASSGHDQL